MAEGFEASHVPQQSRRDKLRVVTSTASQNHPIETGPNFLLPLYDVPSSLISSDLPTYAATCQDFHNQPSPPSSHTSCVVKEEGVNFMGFFGNTVNHNSNASPSSTSTTSHHHHHHHHHHQNPNHAYSYVHHHQSSSSNFPSNPTASIHPHINNHPFVNYSQRDFGDQLMMFKPEPLSLSLSSSHLNNHQLELNLQRYGSSSIYNSTTDDHIVAGPNNDHYHLSRSSVPLGPFTGYAAVLKGSRFLKPAQQLLEEFCGVWCEGIRKEKIVLDHNLIDPSNLECLAGSGNLGDDPIGCGDGGESRRTKSRLISLLDEVYRRYKQYYQQMQEVVTSFECVSGLSNAAPYAYLAIKTMSKHFKCLKNAISDQLQFTNNNKAQAQYSHKYLPGAGFLDQQPVWRPQRGLPERAVSVLRAWLFEHFLHPYPTDTDKLMLAKQTGLSRSQVSNWFINARVRLWKPMVEEIHMLETRQAEKTSSRDHLPSANSVMPDNPSTSTQQVQDISSKRTRNHELHDHLPVGNGELLNLSAYNNLSSHPHVDVSVSIAGGGRGGGHGGVSLTLGLHQNNNCIGLSETFPINAVQRFGLGLEDNGDSYVMGGFDHGQSRHFGRDVIGGQLLHDFVG